MLRPCLVALHSVREAPRSDDDVQRGAGQGNVLESGTLTALISGALMLAVFAFSYASARPGKSEIALRE
jgi:hypothetical protein